MLEKEEILIFLIFLLIFPGFIWQGIYLPKDQSSSEEKLFRIERGENLFQIAKNLEEEDLIKSKFWFNFYILMKGAQRKLQAGDYLFNSSMSVGEITKKIISGDIAKEKITIIEGWDLKQIGSYLENKGIAGAEELDKKRPELEGYLFPDTYWIKKGESLEEIIEKMKANFQKKTKGLKITPEILIMASLLEKEVKTKEDKELVSGILWKRLENNIPLQVDATITYITGKKTIRISKEDIQIDSPYNTYKYLGLPKGPICNPGLESILASIYPKDSPYWYYLSVPGGKTIFSETLEEHNIAKAKYLK
ncbi:MAG: endolytic transglycosylase MltG [Patescibacteria group bacterium]|nr:endolytic transglycosylase MltG [Patescibacteria group bacterium]